MFAHVMKGVCVFLLWRGVNVNVSFVHGQNKDFFMTRVCFWCEK